MATVLKSSELRNLSPSKRSAALGAFLKSVKPVNSAVRISTLNAQLRGYEKKYRMTTSTMLRKVCSGQLPEEGPIATWVQKSMTLRAHQDYAKKKNQELA